MERHGITLRFTRVNRGEKSCHAKEEPGLHETILRLSGLVTVCIATERASYALGRTMKGLDAVAKLFLAVARLKFSQFDNPGDIVGQLQERIL